MEHASMQAEREAERQRGMDPLKGLFLAQQVAPCTLPTRLNAYFACFLARLHLPQMTVTERQASRRPMRPVAGGCRGSSSALPSVMTCNLMQNGREG